MESRFRPSVRYLKVVLQAMVAVTLPLRLVRKGLPQASISLA
jgi:hypothetical protein